MAKKLVRYLLEGDGSVPVFVENGGYFGIGAELIGVSVDEDQRHVPLSVIRMTRADLEARLAGMALKNYEGELLDAAGKEAALEAFLEHVGMSDLA